MLFSSNGFVSPVDQSFTDNNGNFQFDNIPVGSYFVAGWTPAVDWPSTNEFPVGIRRAAIAPISLTGAEGRIEMQLTPTATITGHISATKASDFCYAPDRMAVRSDDGWPGLWMSAVSSNYQVSWRPLPAGSYRFVVPTYPNSCELISIRNGNLVTRGDQPVHLAAENSSLELLFTAIKGEISGAVNGGAGSLPQGYVLLLGSGQSRIRRVVQVDKGHFVFTNVPAGSYSVLAFADFYSAANFSSRASADAPVVTIGYAQEHVENLVLTLR